LIKSRNILRRRFYLDEEALTKRIKKLEIPKYNMHETCTALKFFRFYTYRSLIESFIHLNVPVPINIQLCFRMSIFTKQTQSAVLFCQIWESCVIPDNEYESLEFTFSLYAISRKKPKQIYILMRITTATS
jgi:hypothetical protein